jgi:hypothetical protein
MDLQRYTFGSKNASLVKNLKSKGLVDLRRKGAIWDHSLWRRNDPVSSVKIEIPVIIELCREAF